MKTLDEVIDALERCTDFDAECKGCPYENDNTGGLECEMRNLEEVLYYLKNYKELMDGIVNIIVQYKETFKAIIEDCENENVG